MGQQTQADILSYRQQATLTPCSPPYRPERTKLHTPFLKPVSRPTSPLPGLSPKPRRLQGLGTPSLLVLLLEQLGPPLGLGFLIWSQPLQ